MREEDASCRASSEPWSELASAPQPAESSAMARSERSGKHRRLISTSFPGASTLSSSPASSPAPAGRRPSGRSCASCSSRRRDRENRTGARGHRGSPCARCRRRPCTRRARGESRAKRLRQVVVEDLALVVDDDALVALAQVADDPLLLLHLVLAAEDAEVLVHRLGELVAHLPGPFPFGAV